MNTPTGLEKDQDVRLNSDLQGKIRVLRKQSDIKLREFYDDYEKDTLDLQGLLDKVFLTNGRLFHHERILCWFPRYLELFEET